VLPPPPDVGDARLACDARPNAPLRLASVQPPNCKALLIWITAPVSDVPDWIRSISAPLSKTTPSKFIVTGVAELFPFPLVALPLPAQVLLPPAPVVPGGGAGIPTKTSFKVTEIVQSELTE